MTPASVVAAALGGLLLAYLLGVAWFLRGLRRPASRAHATPMVSVVVAARDEEANIGACLDGLLDQDYPHDRYEVIVVDDGSSDATATVAAARDPGRVRVLSPAPAVAGGASKKVALAIGIAAARGEAILTTDADCRVPPGWVRGLADGFVADTGMVVGFSQIGAPGSVVSLRHGYEAVDFLCLMSCIAGSAGNGHAMAASGQSLAYRRQAFDQVGGFGAILHRASGDDALLLQLIRRRTAWRIRFAPWSEARVIHPPASSWWALLRQRTRWASNAPAQLRLDPPFFAYMVVAFAFDLLLVVAPLLAVAGTVAWSWALGAWAAKTAGEYVLFRRGAQLFERRDLCRYFLLWALLQPLHVVCVGVLGCLGIFTWKGRSHRWGRRRQVGAAGA